MERHGLRLAPRDLYRLRRARLMAQRTALRAQFAQQVLQEISLELERRYGLLAQDAALDIQTGLITIPTTAQDDTREELIRGPADNAHQGPP